MNRRNSFQSFAFLAAALIAPALAQGAAIPENKEYKPNPFGLKEVVEKEANGILYWNEDQGELTGVFIAPLCIDISVHLREWQFCVEGKHANHILIKDEIFTDVEEYSEKRLKTFKYMWNLKFKNQKVNWSGTWRKGWPKKWSAECITEKGIEGWWNNSL